MAAEEHDPEARHPQLGLPLSAVSSHSLPTHLPHFAPYRGEVVIMQIATLAAEDTPGKRPPARATRGVPCRAYACTCLRQHCCCLWRLRCRCPPKRCRL